MTWILCFLVLMSIGSMALAFLAVVGLESSVDALEQRVHDRLALVPEIELPPAKGVAK